MTGTPASDRVLVVIPALDEARRVAATVAAALSLQPARVVVVDDGSRDGTASVARAAGALVATHDHRRGKAAALMTGVRAAKSEAIDYDALLFLDADLEGSAANAAPLVGPVLRGEADMTIATLPGAPGAGGHGFVVRLARHGIERRTGWSPDQPLSGQRCLTRTVFAQVSPLARGFGVEVGMTIDALRAGARLVEVPAELRHRVTGTSIRDQLHRARQYRDVWLALHRRHRASGEQAP